MKGSKFVRFLVTVLVLLVWVDNTIADDMYFVERDEVEGPVSKGSVVNDKRRRDQVIGNIDICLDNNCQPQDPKAEICPTQCVTNEVATQKDLLAQLITEERKAAKIIQWWGNTNTNTNTNANNGWCRVQQRVQVCIT